jgi:hypothetical protein
MKATQVSRLTASSFAALLPVIASAHPGHEAEDLLHAVAHELMTPRGLAALLLVSVIAGVTYKWFRSNR